VSTCRAPQVSALVIRRAALTRVFSRLEFIYSIAEIKPECGWRVYSGADGQRTVRRLCFIILHSSRIFVYLYDLATTDCFNLAVVLQESNKRVQSIQNGCKYRNVMRSEAFELATPLYTAFYCCTSTD